MYVHTGTSSLSPGIDFSLPLARKPLGHLMSNASRKEMGKHGMCLAFENRTVFQKAERKQLPCLVVTGFLGSGKTTLLNHILSSPDHGLRFAIIENEFGEVGVDEKLLSYHNLVVVNNICLIFRLLLLSVVVAASFPQSIGQQKIKFA